MRLTTHNDIILTSGITSNTVIKHSMRQVAEEGTTGYYEDKRVHSLLLNSSNPRVLIDSITLAASHGCNIEARCVGGLIGTAYYKRTFVNYATEAELLVDSDSTTFLLDSRVQQIITFEQDEIDVTKMNIYANRPSGFAKVFGCVTISFLHYVI